MGIERPSRSEFRVTGDGFELKASTRSWQAMVLIPGTAAAMLLLFHPDWKAKLFGCIAVPCMAAFATLAANGEFRVTRQMDVLSIFLGLRQFGWIRRYSWSALYNVRGGDFPETEGWGQRPMFLEGDAATVRILTYLSRERHDWVIEVLREQLESKHIPGSAVS